MSRTRLVRRLVACGWGACLTWAARAALSALPPGGPARWSRINHRGDPVTLLEGPAVVAGTAAAAALAPGLPTRLRAATALAALGAGGFGILDDLAERGGSKGLSGHLGALAHGEVTTGGMKILGIGAAGLAAAALALPPGGPPASRAARAARAADAVAAGALIAGCANLLNLFDLRPGRALKVALLASPAACSAGPAGAVIASATGSAAAVLGDDLGERTMLGDGGANALGAVLGTALVAGARPRTRLAALAAVVGLTLASEKVSFTRVIAATPGLRELDALGRRPAAR
jgi:UDP-GlcNAc:undecaprenyl-phosphate GlcNAc-1-phosphate transferase